MNRRGAPTFSHFAAIDWSGAAGVRHRGIAVALCSPGTQAPALIRPHHRWSREEVLHWLLHEAPPNTLAGFDLGISLAHADAGAFFPGWSESPADARALWALVERICADEPDLAATRFPDHPEAVRHFRRPGAREGDLFQIPGAPDRRGRMRLAEHAQAAMGCRPTSNFNLVGAAQVGKGSLSGMRLLHRLPPSVPVWPIDPLPEGPGTVPGTVVVEIYTSLAALAAGRRVGKAKMRDHGALNAALAMLGSDPVCPPHGDPATPITDHAADALLTAAWLRAHAGNPALWHPPALTRAIAATEGWTFGAL